MEFHSYIYYAPFFVHLPDFPGWLIYFFVSFRENSKIPTLYFTSPKSFQQDRSGLFGHTILRRLHEKKNNGRFYGGFFGYSPWLLQ